MSAAELIGWAIAAIVIINLLPNTPENDTNEE
jgi:hypothetical protein